MASVVYGIGSMQLLLTGASSSIGQSCISLLRSSDHAVLQYAGKQSYITLSKIAAASKASCSFSQADLTKTADLKLLMDLITNMGSIDTFIHSVSAPTLPSRVEDVSLADIERHWKLQAKSFFVLVQHVVPMMKKQKFGRIIGVLTEYVVGKPPPKLLEYVSAKYALLGMIKSLAVELGQFGITWNAVSPGYMESALTEHLPSKLKELIAAQTPTKKLVTPVEVARVINFLASSESGSITGENIVISGGLVMR